MKLSAFITFLYVLQSFKTSYRSVLLLAFAISESTMTFADFLDFSYVSLHRLLFQNSFPQCISKTSPGKNVIFHSIYLPHLHYLFSIPFPYLRHYIPIFYVPAGSYEGLLFIEIVISEIRR